GLVPLGHRPALLVLPGEPDQGRLAVLDGPDLGPPEPAGLVPVGFRGAGHERQTLFGGGREIREPAGDPTGSLSVSEGLGRRKGKTKPGSLVLRLPRSVCPTGLEPVTFSSGG